MMVNLAAQPMLRIAARNWILAQIIVETIHSDLRTSYLRLPDIPATS